MQEEGGGVVADESMKTLLQYPRLLIRCLLLVRANSPSTGVKWGTAGGQVLLWFVNNIVYYGVSLNISAFSGNLFVNNAVFALVEVTQIGSESSGAV